MSRPDETPKMAGTHMMPMADSGSMATRPGVPRDDLLVHAMKYLAAFLLTLLCAGPAMAQTDVPSRATIISMAQHLVQEQFMLGSLGHYHTEFDMAYLHPQPQPDYWAVVGGFVSDQNIPNTFVAAVRLVCPDSVKVKCWRLEKLAINQEIILDRGEPL